MKNLKHTSTLELDIDEIQLWKLLTESEWTKKYMFNCAVKSVFVPGAKIEWSGNFQGYDAYQYGEILDIRPLRLLKYSTIDPNYSDASIPENFIHVTYLIEAKKSGVELTVVNETFDGNGERMEHIIGGWEGVVLPTIKKLTAELKVN